MRYQLNEVLPVIHFEYEGKSNVVNSLFTMPYLYSDVDVTKINFSLLTVVEHHKVSWEYDEEDKKDCNGYLLKDEEGVIYSNQYPEASYGQISTESNWRFDRYFENEAEAKTYFDNIRQYDLIEPHYRLMDMVLRDIQKGIEEITGHLEKEPNPELATKKEKLVSLMDRISKEFMIRYPGWRFEMVKEPVVEGTDYLIWKTKFFQDEKIQVEARELIEKLSSGEGDVEHFFDNEDFLCISRNTSFYAMYEPGQQVTVSYGNYEPGYVGTNEDAWMVTSEERFSVDNLKLAVGVYLYRKYHDPLNETDMGQDYDEIFKKKV